MTDRFARLVARRTELAEAGVLDLGPGSYFEHAFNLDHLLEDATRTLRDVDFDTVVGRGISGLLPLSALAHHLGKHLAVVRKDRMSSHSCMEVEGRIGHRVLFVDDFIATGSTRQATVDELRTVCGMRNHEWKFVGTYEYEKDKFTSYAQSRRKGEML